MPGQHRARYGAKRRDEEDDGCNREYLGYAAVAKQATDHRTREIQRDKGNDTHDQICDEDRGGVLWPNGLHAYERHIQPELRHARRERHEESRGGGDAEIGRCEYPRDENRYGEEAALLDDSPAEIPYRRQLGRLAERDLASCGTFSAHRRHPYGGSSRSARGLYFESRTTGRTWRPAAGRRRRDTGRDPFASARAPA